MMHLNDLIAIYERAMDLDKQGLVDEAAVLYERAYNHPQAGESYRRLYANKLSRMYFRAKKYDLAKNWFAVLGEPMPRIDGDVDSFKGGFKKLQKTGRCLDLTPKALKLFVKDKMSLDLDNDEVELIYFLQVYYGQASNELSPRAERDGFIHHDWRFGQETDDAPREFSQAVGGVTALFKQIGYTPGVQSTEHSDPPAAVLTLERADGERIAFSVENGLEDIAAAFNRELERVHDSRRFVSLETDADWSAYYLLERNDFKTICQGNRPALILSAVPGMELKNWKAKKV